MSQIMKIEVDYTQAARLKEITPEEYATLQKQVDLGLPESREELSTWSSYTAVGTIEDLQLLSDLGIQVKVSRVRGIFAESLPNPNNLAAYLNRPPSQTQIVNVAIPNAGLFSVVQVMVLEDACTEELQRRLDDDWRIVAVCPPNDTRRPTYILGHMNREPK